MRRAAPLLAFGLFGCTDTSHKYPSLLPRPIETQSLAEPDRPVPVATPDAALDTRVAELRAALDSAVKSFNAAAQNAEALAAVAQGMPKGSPQWLDAQSALAELAGNRTATLSALADLEELAMQRGQAGLPPYPSLDAAIAAGAQAADAEDARVRTLEGTVGPAQ